MAKIELTDLQNLENEVSAVGTLNANNARIKEAFEKTLFRDGTAPAQMLDELDMNSNKIINLPAATSPTEPVRKQEFDNATFAALGLTPEDKGIVIFDGAQADVRTLAGNFGVEVVNEDGQLGNPTIILSDATRASLARADTALQPGDVVGGGDMLAANNLSELTNKSAALNNLNIQAPVLADAHNILTVKNDGSGFQIMKRTELLPDDFGWKVSDSLAARHAALVAWAADPRPGKLDRNTDYQIDTATGPLIVSAGKIIDGHNALIYDTTTNGKLITLDKGILDVTTNRYSGGWQIGNLRLQGFGAQGYNNGGIGIFIEGVDNHDEANPTATVFPNYVEGGLLDNIHMSGIGFVGLWQRFVRDARRNNITVDGVGYAGQLLISEIGYRGFQCTSQNIGPGTEPDNIPLGLASTCYGFAFSRQTQGGRMANLTTTPRSADCVIDSWRVVNNPSYTAVDTHAGDHIKILNGYAFGVFKGINIGYEADDVNAHGSIHCLAKNNKLIGIATGTKKTSPGLLNVGYAGAAAGYTEGVVFDSNYIESFGDYTSDNAGGIWLRGTKGARVLNNTTNTCRPHGTTLESDNIGFVVSGNTNKNAHGQTAASGIHLYGANNVGTFSSNTAKKEGYYGEPTMGSGYDLTSVSAGNVVKFLGGDYFETTDTMTQYSISSSVAVRQNPRRRTFPVQVTIASGGTNGSSTYALPEPFNVAPKGVSIEGPAFAGGQIIVKGYSLLDNVQITVVVYSVTGALASGATIDLLVTVEGW